MDNFYKAFILGIAVASAILIPVFLCVKDTNDKVSYLANQIQECERIPNE